MKFKLAVLTLLVVGLVVGVSSSTRATVTISFNDALSIDDATVELYATGIPATVLTYANDSTEVVTVEELALETVGTTDVDEFMYSIWLDADKNGYVSGDDEELMAAAAAPAAGTFLANVADFDIPDEGSVSIIIIVDMIEGATTAADDVIAIGADPTAENNVADGAVKFVNSLTSGAEPDATTGNVATITAVTASPVGQTLTQAAAAIEVAAAVDVPNRTDEVELLNFKLTAGASFGQVLNALQLAAGDSTDLSFGYDESDVIENVMVYIDEGTVGTLDGADVQLQLDDDEITGMPAQLVLIPGVFVAANEDVTILVAVSLNGMAATDDVIGANTDVLNYVVSENDDAAGADVQALGVTVEALDIVAAGTQDLTGPPFERPNGILDAAKLTFSQDVDDATVLVGVNNEDLTVDNHDLTFSSTYYGDSADDEIVYLEFIEEEWYYTDETLDYYYDTVAANVITSKDGKYGLAYTDETLDDMAPPAPLMVETIDTDGYWDNYEEAGGNGKLDQINFWFSEWMDEYTIDGFTISGYEIDDIDEEEGWYEPWGSWLPVYHVYIEEIEDGYDTGVTPPFTYSTTVGILADEEENKVQSFNQLDVPVTDNANPKLWRVKTLDMDSDGQFDALQLDFSEPVQLNTFVTTLTAADLTKNVDYWDTEGFFFGDGHTDTYDFAVTGNTGLGTSQLIFPVNEVGSFDTGVLPGLIYVGTDTETSPLVDMASNPLWTQWYEDGNWDWGGSSYPMLEFEMVEADTLVTEVYEVWLEDGISPQITSASWLDGNEQTGGEQNGKLDTVYLTFSEPMGTDADTYESLDIAGHDVDGAVIEGANVYVLVDEDGYDTGDTPDITYDDDEIEDANGAELSELTTDSVVEADNAFPIIYEAKTADEGYGSDDLSTAHDGMLDAIIAKFSEPMDIEDIEDVDLAEEFSTDDDFYAVGDTVKFIDSQTAVMYIVADYDSLDTEVTLNLLYTPDDPALADMAGLELAAIATLDLIEEDGAPPVAIAAETVDAIRFDLMRAPIRVYDDTDGYLDGVIITFSEEIGDVDTTLADAGVTLTEEMNAIDLVMSGMISDPDDPGRNLDDRRDDNEFFTIDGATVQILGLSAMGVDKWDTGQTPFVMIAADNGIADGEGNVVAAVDSIPTTDAAIPLITRANASVDSKNIYIWFSEPVVNSDDNGPIDEGDIEYGSDNNGFAIVALTDEGSVYIAETDTVITLNEASFDWINAVEDAIEDLVGNVALDDKVDILDELFPSLTDIGTQDVDTNGLIDHIKLTYSEGIRDATITGNLTEDGYAFARNDKLVDSFEVGGFEVIGFNLCGDIGEEPEEGEEDEDWVDGDDLAADVTAYLIGESVLSEGESVLNVMDVANDNVLWLMVKAVEAPAEGEGNTDAMPTFYMLGGPNGTSISDFRPNYAGTIGAQAPIIVPDKAGPTIMKAEMPTQEIVHVWMSEPLLDMPAVTSVFVWEVGTEKVDYVEAGYVVNWNRISEATATYELVLAGILVPVNSPSTLNFIDADVLFDSEEIGNVVRLEDVDVYPPQFGVAVEDAADVPGEFALSKNFPNPFNPSTTINYDIAGNGGHVSLVIYNMTGQKVRTLVNEAKAPGYYSVMWNGADDAGSTVSSGIYLYKIDCGDFSRIEKMTFVK
ncbi:FlgD immunoglobulin-like domain containing protein [Candidatus Latescibacterota bacterium]